MTEPKKHDNVKFKVQLTGDIRYGTVNGETTIAGSVGKATKPDHKLWDVVDAVLPVRYDVLGSEILEIIKQGKFDRKICSFDDEYHHFINAEYEKAKELSASVPKGQIKVGSMFNFVVGDGRAYYVVTKVNKKTCNVEWRGFGADTYTDHYFGWGREKVPIEDVLPLVEREQALQDIFSGEETL